MDKIIFSPADNNISEKERGTTSYVDKIARNKYLKNGDSN